MTALPAVGLCKGVESDPLLDGIRLHLKMIEAINALPDDVDGDVTEADAILAEALTHPVTCLASAFAVISLALDEVELLVNSWMSELFQARAREARDFLAGRVA